jgi:hypothetical protein
MEKHIPKQEKGQEEAHQTMKQLAAGGFTMSTLCEVALQVCGRQRIGKVSVSFFNFLSNSIAQDDQTQTYSTIIFHKMGDTCLRTLDRVENCHI